MSLKKAVFLSLVCTATLSFTACFSSIAVEEKAKQDSKQVKNTNTSKTESKPASSTEKQTSKSQKVLYSIDFAEIAKKNSDPRKWFSDNGFSFKSAADNQNKLNLSLKNRALYFNSKSGIFSLILKKTNIKNASKLRVTWGVDKFPAGASYKKGVNNEAVMIYTYFGTKELSSDSLFIPDSPYFIGIFLGNDEDLDKPYTGKHFKEGGRFICVGMPRPGETVTTDFDLTKYFKECFGENMKVPFISGIAFETETSNSGDATAFVKKVEYVE